MGREAIRPLVYAACLIPLALGGWDAFTGGLGADPIKTLIHRTGTWTMALLLITLTVTPLRRVSGWAPLAPLRRPLGLFAFFYACLHLAAYVGLDQFFDLSAIAEDVAKRPFITMGFAVFLLLIPLAVTSTQGMIRRLGGARWRRLHRLVYVAAIGGVVHHLWSVKADLRRPILFGLILAVLLAGRVWTFGAPRLPFHRPQPVGRPSPPI